MNLMRLNCNCEMPAREGKRFRQDGLPKRRDYMRGGLAVKINRAERAGKASNGGLEAFGVEFA